MHLQMNVRTSNTKQGIIGLCGHAGIGHTHSHMGMVQDDSVGFSVAAYILSQALPIDANIESVEADLNEGQITVKTADGGVGSARARRGVTPYEVRLMEQVKGFEAYYSQEAVLTALGRMYGQGVDEVPTALQQAITLALVDTFRVKWPEYVRVVPEDLPGQVGQIAGAVVDIHGVSVSLLMVVNASEGGIGPVEDLEGNVPLGAKGILMRSLGMHRIPTLIPESKVFAPTLCKELKENTFMIRANHQSDNIVTAQSMVEAAEKAGIPCVFLDDVFHRNTDEYHQSCVRFGDRIAQIGQRLKTVATAAEKVSLTAELAVLVSQDAGGISFMSSDLQEVVSSAGLLPGTSAVLSMLVPETHIRKWKIPALGKDDLQRYLSIVLGTIPILARKIEEADQELKQKAHFDPDAFRQLFALDHGEGSEEEDQKK